jgi:putative hydrolase of the HAD superfamily
MIRGVIFDMDGVIIDSNTFHYNNWNGYFEDRFKVTLPKEEFSLKLGESHRHFTEYFADKYAPNSDIKKIEKDIYQRYIDIREKIPLKQGVKKTLEKLKKNKFKIALATGANKEAAHHIIERFELKDYFDFVIAGDEVKRAKPNPEIFLKAAEGLNLRPEECVVIEDALMGLQAAKSAGMKCIMVEDEITKYQDHSRADAKISSLIMILDVLKDI